MKIKFLSMIIVCALLMAVLVSCNAESTAYTEYGKDVIALMAEMIESDAYRSLYNLSEDFDEKIGELREGDYSKISSVYEICIPMDDLTSQNEFDVALDNEDLSENLYEYICSSAHLSVSSLINIPSGTEAVTLSAVFSAIKCFADKNIDESKTLLYVFEKGCPIIVSFVCDGDGAFRAVGYLIINDDFKTDDVDSIKESWEALGIENVTVKKQ